MLAATFALFGSFRAALGGIFCLPATIAELGFGFVSTTGHEDETDGRKRNEK